MEPDDKSRRRRNDDFTIDFAKHGKTLDAAMEADARYWRENDAKFRAVNQKVGSYDEFRDIVRASHLKPLEKGDRISDMKNFNQPWNICAKKGDNQATGSAGATGSTKEFTLPKTSLEFARDWRRQPSNDQKLSYLHSIPMEKLRRLFQNDTGFGLMGEIISLLSKEDILDSHWTVDLLSSCDRFSLTVQFMSKEEKEACAKLLKRLETEPGTDFSERLEDLAKRYEVGS